MHPIKVLASVLLLTSACTAVPTARPAAAPAPSAPALTGAGLSAVIGQTAAALQRTLGKPELDIREGDAVKLQFVGPACVLDAYLYPRSRGAEPIVTYLDTRQPGGEDIDRASCIAALQAQKK